MSAMSGRQLSVDLLLLYWKQSLHCDAVWRSIEEGPARQITFTRYESVPVPGVGEISCPCSGCALYRREVDAVRERMLAMTDEDFAVVMEQLMVEEYP